MLPTSTPCGGNPDGRHKHTNYFEPLKLGFTTHEPPVAAGGSLLFIAPIQHERHNARYGAKSPKDNQKCRSNMYRLPEKKFHEGYTHASNPHSQDSRRPSFYRTPSTKEKGYGCEPGNSTRTVGSTDKIISYQKRKVKFVKKAKRKGQARKLLRSCPSFLRPLLFYNRQKIICTLYSNDGFTITILLSTRVYLKTALRCAKC